MRSGRPTSRQNTLLRTLCRRLRGLERGRGGKGHQRQNKTSNRRDRSKTIINRMLWLVFAVQLLGLAGLGGLWLLDVAEAVPFELYNGFFQLDADQGFHIGLWLAVGSYLGIWVVTLVMIMVLLVREDR